MTTEPRECDVHRATTSADRQRAASWLEGFVDTFTDVTIEALAREFAYQRLIAGAATGAAVWAAVDQALEAETWCPRDVTRPLAERLRARLAALRTPPPGGGEQ